MILGGMGHHQLRRMGSSQVQIGRGIVHDARVVTHRGCYWYGFDAMAYTS